MIPSGRSLRTGTRSASGQSPARGQFSSSTAPAARRSFAGFEGASPQQEVDRVRHIASAAATSTEAGMDFRAQRRQQTQEWLESKNKTKWWLSTAENVEVTEDMAEVEMILGSAALHKPKPCVVHFFASDCHGCKAMHPKVNQIMERNKDVHFVKVNCSAQDAKYTLHSRYQISKLPYFMVFANEELVTEFTCNLTTVKRLRTAIEQARNVGVWAVDDSSPVQHGGSAHSPGSSFDAAA